MVQLAIIELLAAIYFGIYMVSDIQLGFALVFLFMSIFHFILDSQKRIKK